jgi:hypothetical protein
VRRGKHGARSTKQAIAIGCRRPAARELSCRRRAPIGSRRARAARRNATWKRPSIRTNPLHGRRAR